MNRLIVPRTVISARPGSDLVRNRGVITSRTTLPDLGCHVVGWFNFLSSKSGNAGPVKEYLRLVERAPDAADEA